MKVIGNAFDHFVVWFQFLIGSMKVEAQMFIKDTATFQFLIGSMKGK